jgi:hypothetical protein
MILADRRDYKYGYRKHLAAYQYLERTNKTVQSRCLLLVYSVECGLKCLLLSKWRENNPKDILADKSDKRYPIMTSHNLQELLKELEQTRFRFPQMITVHKNIVSSAEYHQLCRYGVQVKDNYKMERYEQVLNDIAEWIGEEIAG